MLGECPFCSSDRLERQYPASAIVLLVLGSIALFDLVLQLATDGPNQRQSLLVAGGCLGVGLWRWVAGKMRCIECGNKFTRSKAFRARPDF